MSTRIAAVAVFIIGIGVLAWSFVVKANREAGPTAGRPTPPPAHSILPAGLFLNAEPADAVQVEDARKTAKAGDTVTVRGRVGGSKEPFVDGRAMVTIVGRGIPACTDLPGHECPTPWDYCHETSASIAQHSATVQIVDSAGNVLKESLKQRNGITGLTELVVVATVAQTEGDTLVLNATGLYVAAP